MVGTFVEQALNRSRARLLGVAINVEQRGGHSITGDLLSNSQDLWMKIF